MLSCHNDRFTEVVPCDVDDQTCLVISSKLKLCTEQSSGNLNRRWKEQDKMNTRPKANVKSEKTDLFSAESGCVSQKHKESHSLPMVSIDSQCE